MHREVLLSCDDGILTLRVGNKSVCFWPEEDNGMLSVSVRMKAHEGSGSTLTNMAISLIESGVCTEEETQTLRDWIELMRSRQHAR